MSDTYQRQWLDPKPVYPDRELISIVNGNLLAAEILARRGFNDPAQVRAFLFPEYYIASPPTDFPGMDGSVVCILDAIRDGKDICVWGDFDVDGQTSTTILVSTLKKLNARVRHYIPNRERESHGVHMESLKRLIADGVQLLVTCDTGISAMEETAWARSQGVDVVITDHHELPDLLPVANAIINPHLLPSEHPLYTLPGCGVAYKLAEELLSRSGMPEYASTLLDLTALGIVADVAPLRGDARYLLQLGLESLREPQRVGLKRLYASAGVEPNAMNEQTIGFALTPRLNALGRLDDANPIVDFFTTESNTEAVIFSNKLEELNTRRRAECDHVYKGAIAQVETEPNNLNFAALVLSHPDWPAGVIGIVAARLVERYHRPVILFKAPIGGIAKGSARSIPGINITEAIKRQSVKLNSFGGHPMAAGLSLPTSHLPDFRQALSYTILQMTEGIELVDVLNLDAILPLDTVTLDTINALEFLSPFGNGNPSPVFMSPNHRIIESLPIGTSKEHLLVKVEDQNGNRFDVLLWSGADLPLPEGSFDLAYTPRSSSYKGAPKLQFEWVDVRPARILVSHFKSGTRLQVEDLRHENGYEFLKIYAGNPETAVWCEGLPLPGIELLSRTKLHRADTLIIAFAPPSAEAIKRAMGCVKPGKVILLSAIRTMDDPQQLLNILMKELKKTESLVKNNITYESLAELTGQRIAVIRLALGIFQISGQMLLEENDNSTIFLKKGSGIPTGDVNSARNRLIAVMEETAAFRRRFLASSKDALIRDYFN